MTRLSSQLLPTASPSAASTETSSRGTGERGAWRLAYVAQNTANEPQTVFVPIHCLLWAGRCRDANLPTTAPAGSARKTGARMRNELPLLTHYGIEPQAFLAQDS
jgi:hypothetical protein